MSGSNTHDSRERRESEKFALEEVNRWLETPAADAIRRARESVDAMLPPDAAATATRFVVQRLREWLARESSPLRARLPPSVVTTLREAIAHPVTVERQFVVSLLERPRVRSLIRALLLDEILAFGRKAAAPVSGVARGLGSIARIAGERMRGAPGIGSLVDVVGDEVERQLEARAQAFADAAVGRIIQRIADLLSNPRNEREAREIRLAVIDGFLELRGPALASALEAVDAPAVAQRIDTAVRSLIDSDEVASALKLEGQSLKQLLSSLGVSDEAREAMAKRLAHGLAQRVDDYWARRRAP